MATTVNKQSAIPTTDAASLDQQIAELDRVDEILQEKLKKLEELKTVASKLKTDDLVGYTDPSDEFTMTTQNLGEDDSKFIENLMNKYVVLMPPGETKEGYEGFYERYENNTVIGYFRYINEGVVYFGLMHGHNFHGEMVTLVDGEQIVTNVKGGIAQGFSKFVQGQETRYGHMYNGELVDGEVVYKLPNGAKLYTKMENGKISSNATAKTPLGSKFEGKLLNLSASGHLTPGTTLYHGSLDPVSKLPEGQGVLFLPAQLISFTGEFKKGILNGQGSYRDEKTGEEFKGEFKKGKVEGKGSHWLPGKFKYEGDFRGGKYQGQGTFTYEGQGTYQGQFTDGRFEGQGKVMTADGDFLEGEFKDWNPAGELKLKNPSGKEYKGKFKEGLGGGEAQGGGCGPQGCGGSSNLGGGLGGGCGPSGNINKFSSMHPTPIAGIFGVGSMPKVSFSGVTALPFCGRNFWRLGMKTPHIMLMTGIILGGLRFN